MALMILSFCIVIARAGIPVKEGLRRKVSIRFVDVRLPRTGIPLEEGLRLCRHIARMNKTKPRTGIPLEEGLRQSPPIADVRLGSPSGYSTKRRIKPKLAVRQR